jgi:hypothetical protein
MQKFHWQRRGLATTIASTSEKQSGTRRESNKTNFHLFLVLISTTSKREYGMATCPARSVKRIIKKKEVTRLPDRLGILYQHSKT